ncbi:hypothetical protein F5141DRAFT_624472 [Pisolithus sp. B1]|nr:hypothetical protein F5141DRAFT_624472 [Pisolithus sp. B1]
MDYIIFSPSSTPLHITLNGWSTQRPQNPRYQQDCHFDHAQCGAAPGDGCAINQSQVAERILSSPTDNFPVPPATCLQGFNRSSSTFSTSHLPVPARVELPLDSIAENEVLPIVSPSLDRDSIPVPRYQDMAWNSRHAQVNYFSRSPTMYGDEDGRFPVVRGQPAQLPHHTFHIPIIHAHIPLESRFPGTYPVNAITPFCDGVALERTSDSSAYGSFALPSLSASILLPHTAGYPSGHLQGDEDFSEFGKPPSVHRVTAGPTASLAFTAIPRDLTSHHEGVSRYDGTSSSDPDVSSWTVSPNPIIPLLQGPYPSGYLASWNIPTSLEWAESSAWLRNQPCPPSYEQTEIVSAPVLPHILPYTAQPSSQSNSNAVGNLRTSPSIPRSPGPPSSVTYAHDGTLLVPMEPPVAGYLHTKFVVDSCEANSGRGRTRACHQAKIKGNLRASKPISTRRAGHF